MEKRNQKNDDTQNKEKWLLILEGRERTKDPRIGYRMERKKALTTVSSSGAKVVHDSGGRLIVIEAPGEAKEMLNERLEGIRLVPIDENVAEHVEEATEELDPSEELFLRALSLRNSERYLETKRQRPGPGETPEEEKLLSNPEGCIQED